METKKQRKARLKKEAAAKKAAEEKAKQEAAVKKAKALRTYIVKNGEKHTFDADHVEYWIEKKKDQNGKEFHNVMLIAIADTNSLTFTWNYQPEVNPSGVEESLSDQYYFELTIDLTVKGTPKTGEFSYRYSGGDDDESADYFYSGKITTEFNHKNKGITLARYAYNEYNENSTNPGHLDKHELTAKKDLKGKESMAYSQVDQALSQIEAVALKDLGYRWQELGFTKF